MYFRLLIKIKICHLLLICTIIQCSSLYGGSKPSIKKSHKAEKKKKHYLKKCLVINTKTPVQHLFTAIEQGNHTAINRLLNELSIKNNLDTKYPEYNHHTFLGYAISQDKYEIAYSLLYKGATINTRSGIKLETPLQLALTRKRAATLIASLLSYTDTLNINATNYLNQNALHYAVFFKQNKFIPLLIKKGINIHHHDISGATALTLARGESLLYGQFVHNQEAIDILEAHGANRDFLLAAVAALEKID